MQNNYSIPNCYYSPNQLYSNNNYPPNYYPQYQEYYNQNQNYQTFIPVSSPPYVINPAYIMRYPQVATQTPLKKYPQFNELYAEENKLQ